MSTELPSSEFDARLAAVRDRIAEAGVDAGVWFGATAIEYLSGFAHIQTERPVALAVTDGTVALVVPRLEVERAGAVEHVDRVGHYFDYPSGEPVKTVAELLADLGAESVAADADGAPGVMGYQGPPFPSTSRSRRSRGSTGCAGRRATPRWT